MAVMDWDMLDKYHPDYIGDEEMSIPSKNNGHVSHLEKKSKYEEEEDCNEL